MPSYLSEQSRDIISRMLVTDPLKRITVEEIRTHPWFVTKLPRYIALGTQSIRQLLNIDERVLKLVEERVGYSREKVIHSLKKGKRNCYAVAYQLLKDSIVKMDISEEMEAAVSSGSLDMLGSVKHNHQDDIFCRQLYRKTDSNQ